MSSGRSAWLGAYAVHTGPGLASYRAFAWIRRVEPYDWRVGSKPRYPVPSADCCSKCGCYPDTGGMACLMTFMYHSHVSFRDYASSSGVHVS